MPVQQIEQAGGYSSCDGKLVSGLDVTVNDHDQRTQVRAKAKCAFSIPCLICHVHQFSTMGYFF